MLQFKHYFSWSLVLVATLALIASARAEECGSEQLALPSYYAFLGKYRMDKCKGVGGMGEHFNKDLRKSDRHHDLSVEMDPTDPNSLFLTEFFTIEGKNGFGQRGPTVVPFINAGEKRTKQGKSHFYQKAEGGAEEIESTYIEQDNWNTVIQLKRTKLSFKKGDLSKIVFETSFLDPRVGKVWFKCEGHRTP